MSEKGQISIVGAEILISYRIKTRILVFSTKEAKYMANEILRLVKKVEVKKITEGMEKRQQKRSLL